MSDSKVNRLIASALADSEEVTPLRPEDLPLEPLFWHIVVAPLQPKKKSDGGIIIHDEAQRVEKIQNTIGRVLYVGPLAFKGRAASGLSLADDPRATELKPGDHVLFARYTGQNIQVRARNGDQHLVILLSDTELLAIVKDPERIRFWI